MKINSIWISNRKFNLYYLHKSFVGVQVESALLSQDTRRYHWIVFSTKVQVLKVIFILVIPYREYNKCINRRQCITLLLMQKTVSESRRLQQRYSLFSNFTASEGENEQENSN